MVDVSITRIPISLPCQVRVDPATGRTDRLIEERPEHCATDAWWMVGVGIICDEHLRVLLGDQYDQTCGDVELNPSELVPWRERHRYPQDEVVAPGSPAHRPEGEQ